LPLKYSGSPLENDVVGHRVARPRGDVVRFLGICQLCDGVWVRGPVHRDLVLSASIDRHAMDHLVQSSGSAQLPLYVSLGYIYIFTRPRYSLPKVMDQGVHHLDPQVQPTDWARRVPPRHPCVPPCVPTCPARVRLSPEQPCMPRSRSSLPHARDRVTSRLPPAAPRLRSNEPPPPSRASPTEARACTRVSQQFSKCLSTVAISKMAEHCSKMADRISRMTDKFIK
jgi:hypothetical protein